MKHNYNDDEDIVLYKHLIEKLEEKEISNLKVSMSISKWEGTLFTLTNESGLISCQWNESETTSDFINRMLSLINLNNGL
jgi:hypothetical protein